MVSQVSGEWIVIICPAPFFLGRERNWADLPEGYRVAVHKSEASLEADRWILGVDVSRGEWRMTGLPSYGYFNNENEVLNMVKPSNLWVIKIAPSLCPNLALDTCAQNFEPQTAWFTSCYGQTFKD